MPVAVIKSLFPELKNYGNGEIKKLFKEIFKSVQDFPTLKDYENINKLFNITFSWNSPKVDN